jgi:hypothetical protein
MAIPERGMGDNRAVYRQMGQENDKKEPFWLRETSRNASPWCRGGCPASQPAGQAPLSVPSAFPHPDSSGLSEEVIESGLEKPSSQE